MEYQVEDNIEFSSKNVVSSTQLFKKKENDLRNYINSGSKKTPNTNKEKILPNNFNQKIIHSSETKINDYYKNKDDKLPTDKALQDKLTRLISENEKLTKDAFEKNKLLLEKDKENERLRIRIRDDEESIKSLSIIHKQYDTQISQYKANMVRILREFEELKRAQRRQWINEQNLKLGRFVVQRAGNQIIEVWEDGEDVIKVKNRLQKILIDKDEFEKVRNKLNRIYSNAKKNNDNTIETHEMYEINEQRELINFKLNALSEDEKEFKAQLDRYEIDKINYQIEYKRIIEEDKCRYGIGKIKDRWPTLAGRYMILSLLGRGGYSEVYKAYDLENNIEVACKIHQLNPQWTQIIKENYIKHTIRENQIHKEINHPKVVRHYDTIEIDDCSFCTVLEICSGPDLYTYLKIHKTLSEKEAKFIVSQILSGLEYLNKLQKKIIHYDLKPQNILFHNMEVKISDFGLAKVMEDNSDKIELTSQGVGTYWYLPPECFEQYDKCPPVISNKVDIWSIGVILYEIIFGRRPFGHSMSQDRILKEGIITNAKTVEFPSNIKVSDECRVNLINLGFYKTMPCI
jgi:tousled-like kinase